MLRSRLSRPTTHLRLTISAHARTISRTTSASRPQTSSQNSGSAPPPPPPVFNTPPPAIQTQQPPQREEGDISAAFASLSGHSFQPLHPRYAALKRRLLAGREDAVRASWVRLLAHLREEVARVEVLKNSGVDIVPEVAYEDISNRKGGEAFKRAYRETGVAVVRAVVPEAEALAWKAGLRKYIAQNPQTKAYPPDDPQVYELYWSPSQLAARAHPNLLATQRFLMSYWHTAADPTAPISLSQPIVYADRLRMRQPGDAKFALGPHVDGGSVERWEEEGYGPGHVYDAVWSGRWEEHDPWEASCRLAVTSNRYEGIGACSMFRMVQGWLAMSETGPNEGTLLVNPMLKGASAYFLLRPFFEPVKPRDAFEVGEGGEDAFLDARNWRLEETSSSWVQGATPGHAQELREELHPHLRLDKTMVHIPKVRPGDYVAWHCDTVHAVDSVHAGTSDSSVMYIPTCALTESNAEFLLKQRATFQTGEPGPDYGGGIGESAHMGRWGPLEFSGASNRMGRQAMGLEAFDATAPGLSEGEEKVLRSANRILGF